MSSIQLILIILIFLYFVYPRIKEQFMDSKAMTDCYRSCKNDQNVKKCVNSKCVRASKEEKSIVMERILSKK